MCTIHKIMLNHLLSDRADLADDPPGLWAVDATGQSGHPGSPHYGDQLNEWLAGRHHYLPLDGERARAQAASTLTLSPG